MNINEKDSSTDLEFSNNKKILDIFDNYKIIVQTFIHKIINDLDFKISKDDKKNFLTKKINIIDSITEKIMDQKINIEILNNIYCFIEKLDKCDITIDNYYSILYTFVKKYLNNQNILKNKEKIIYPDVLKLLNENQDNANKFLSVIIN
jgi:hypothetical protein